ncbi:hypothetical protein ACT8ZV_00300 [Nocardioides sp. MAHUQ-72]|uniref:hypothetical protein n=1 Tax=unclassified Nocardioides TaxID=2615069 RepID=UPI0036198D6D
MAHTDKTKPLKVRIWHDALVRVELHDHRDGQCDLPTSLGDLIAQAWDPTSCTWDHLWTGIGVCPCGWCTGAHWRRAENRRERQRVRASLREAKKEWDATGHCDE